MNTSTTTPSESPSPRSSYHGPPPSSMLQVTYTISHKFHYRLAIELFCTNFETKRKPKTKTKRQSFYSRTGAVNLCCNTKSIVTRITSIFAVQSIFQSSQWATCTATGSSPSSENASKSTWFCWNDGST